MQALFLAGLLVQKVKDAKDFTDVRVALKK